MTLFLSKKISPHHRKALVFISSFLLVFYLLLILQFFKLQILEGEKWNKEAQLQHEQCILEPFERGRFFSNLSITSNNQADLQPLVFDVQMFHLFADPASIDQENKLKIENFLTSKLRLSKDQLDKIHQDLFRKCRSRKLLSWLSLQKKEIIEKWWKEFYKKEKLPKNAIFFIKDFKRSYPFKSLLGQVLSGVQEEKDPYSQASIPIGGLELYFDPFLQGKMGKRLFLRSPNQPLEAGKLLLAPQHGADIFLTINHYLQAIAEQELKKGIERVKAKGGWAIVMNPKTGEILAVAQYPFFDPSDYNHYFNDKSLEEHTRCKAVLDAFEPGSIFKPITLTICFLANEELKKRGEKPLFSPEEKVSTASGYFPKRKKPLKDGHLHHFLNMDMAIQKSSNVYMGKMAERIINRLGAEWLRKTLVDVIGLGRKTGIELPAETPGFVPTLGKFHASGRPEWSADMPYSLVIGHSILVTSLQLSCFFSMIANGGYEVKPTLVKKILQRTKNNEEEILFDLEEKLSHQERKRILNEEICQRLIQAMKFATKQGGTSSSAEVWGFTEAGKSGTSEKIINGQYSNEKYISSFVGLVPAKNPLFVIIVSLDEPSIFYIEGKGKSYHGGICAAPIFSSIASRSLEYLGVTPDDPFGYPPKDPRRNGEKADFIKEVKELQKLYQTWNHQP